MSYREPEPTLSMQVMHLVDGTYAVNVLVLGLFTQEQAELAMKHMEKLFASEEIKLQ